MLRDVTYSVTDGQLGLANATGTGIHVKIGASPVKTEEAIVISGTMSAKLIKDRLGLSPLADAVMDGVENGAAKIYCLPVAARISGTLSEINKEPKNAAGSMSIEGTPTNAFKIIVKMVGKGGLNTAVFRYSLNDGITWSEDITVPTSGKYTAEEAGLTFVFQLEADAQFAVGDYFTAATTEPQLSNEDILAAAKKLKDISVAYEFVHVVGATSPELWSAMSVIQKELLEKYRKPVFIVMEAYRKEAETETEYIAGLQEARRKISNYDLQVVSSRGYYTGMDNVTRDINLANIVCGLYARASVQESIGRTAAYSLSEDKLSGLFPADEDSIEQLDLDGYLTFRRYDGLTGYYVTNARMMGPEDTDFRYAEDIRVKNKIIRLTRQAALKQLQSDVDISNLEADLAAKAQFISADVEKEMVDKKEISALRVMVPAEQDVLTTEKMEMQIRYVPIGKIREIAIDLGMENPYAS